jgi:WD40 repeat protein
MPRLLALTVLSLLSTASPAATLAAHLAIVDANSGSGTVQFTATEPWTATASDTWLTVTPASGTASELLTYTFTANPGPNGRMAALNINGQTFTVVQPSSTSLFTPWGPSVKGRIRTLAGNDGQLRSPRGIAVDANGNVYIADTSNHRVCKLSASSNTLSTVAGTGAPGFSGDNGPATAAQLNTPTALTVDPAGNLYIADSGNLRVRRLDAQTGILSTTAGNGVAAYTGDGGPALSAGFLSVHSLALDPSGNLFIADSANHRIRRLDAATGHISTAAGTGVAGFSGDDALATAAQLNAPNHLAFDPLGNNLYIGDSGNALIRRVDAATGLITTVSTPQSDTSSFAAGPDGTLFVLRSGVINKLNIATGTATPIPATAPISNVHAVAVDGAGNLYLAADTIYVVDFTSPTHTLTPTFPLGDQSFTLTTLTQDGLRPAAGSAPALLSAAPAFPANIVNAIQTFNVTARDLDGASNIARFYFLIAPTPVISTNGCHGFYDRGANTFYLYNNDLTALTTSGNSQCAILANQSAANPSGTTDLTLQLALQRKGLFATGTQTVYLWTTDAANAGTGWIPAATWLP